MIAAALFGLYVAGAYVTADYLDRLDEDEPSSHPLTNPALTLGWPIVGALLFVTDLCRRCAEAKARLWS